MAVQAGSNLRVQPATESAPGVPPTAVSPGTSDDGLGRTLRGDPARFLDFNRWWLGATVMSLGALAILAPAGLYLIAFLGLIIVAHELGHFLMARRSGMVPTELFWGFGPEVIAIQHRGCRYGIKALFLGGYVKLEGMTPTSEVPEHFEERGTYRAASHRGRLATILAGPAVNLVMAYLAFSAAAVVEGESISGASVSGLGDVWFVISATGQALWLWVANIGGYAAALFDSSGSTEAPVRFLSPVAQADVSRQAVGLGIAATLQWFGILSCAIGAINLLPLPPLDGSHALVAGAEGLVQRVRRNREVRFNVARLLPLAYITVGVLVALSISALVLDIRDLV